MRNNCKLSVLVHSFIQRISTTFSQFPISSFFFVLFSYSFRFILDRFLVHFIFISFHCFPVQIEICVTPLMTLFPAILTRESATNKFFILKKILSNKKKKIEKSVKFCAENYHPGTYQDIFMNFFSRYK